MVTRVGINGFGRIGRQVLKALLDRHPHDVEVVAINDLFDTATNAHLLQVRHHTTAATRARSRSRTNEIVVNGKRDPASSPSATRRSIPWKQLGAEIVIESTGLFTDAEKAKAHSTPARRRSSSRRPPRTRTSPSCSA